MVGSEATVAGAVGPAAESPRPSRTAPAGRTTATTTSTTRMSSRPDPVGDRRVTALTTALQVVPVVADALGADLEDGGAGPVGDAAVAVPKRPGPLDDGAVADHAHPLHVDLEVAVALEQVVEVGADRLAALVRGVGRLVVDGVGGVGGRRPVGVADLQGLAELLEVVGRAGRAGVDHGDLGGLGGLGGLGCPRVDGDAVLGPG